MEAWITPERMVILRAPRDALPQHSTRYFRVWFAQLQTACRRRTPKRKSPPIGGLFVFPEAESLLDLRFLVDHVLAHDRIVLLHFHLVGRGLLLSVGRLEIAGGRPGNERGRFALF